MWRKLARIVGLMALLAGAAGGLLLALRPRPVLVETEEVRRGRFEVVVEEDGRTRVRDRYVASAPVAGRVLRLTVRPGDMVRRDDTLAIVLAAPSALLGPRARREAEERLGSAEAMLQQAGALMERATAQQSQAEVEAARVRILHARGAVPLQQLERAELAERIAVREMLAAERRRHAAEHELAQARALLESAEGSAQELERQEVRSPVNGRVLRVLQESETIVPSGAPLVELGDPTDLEVIVDVLTTQAVGIASGAPVAIERWGGPSPLQGRVRLVEPGAFTRVSALGVEEQRVWVVIDLVEPHGSLAALGDGFRVDALITVEVVDDAVILPVSAVFRSSAGWAVFIVHDGVARERALDILRRGGRSARVGAGVAPGERVVLFPPSALRDGSRVRPVR